MNFSIYIAKRYLFSKSTNNTVNTIATIAGIGVIVGAMSLFIVLSGFSGLKEFSLQFSNYFDSDLKVYPQKGKTFTISTAQEQLILGIDGIQVVSKSVEERIFLNFKGKNTIALIKGVDENYQKVTFIDSMLIAGHWFEEQQTVVAGIGISRFLGLGVYDYSDLLDLYVPKPGVGQITDPARVFNKDRVIVSGIYHVNEDLNSKYIFSSLKLAQSLLEMSEEQITSLEIKLAPQYNEKRIIEKLNSILQQEIMVKNRVQQNDALYKMLNTEHLAVYLIFTLVLIIALFNVIASIVMIILDKKHNIKTFFHLGATTTEIRRIFYVQGVLMSVAGGIIGILIGVVVVILQLKLDLVMITGTLPYPIKLEFINILLVFITITVLGIIASRIASGKVNDSLMH